MNTDQETRSGCLPVLGLIVSVLYLANFSLGVVEIPDNLPFIGNLDEVFFSGILFASLARLGVRLPFTGAVPAKAKSRSIPPSEGHAADEH